MTDNIIVDKSMEFAVNIVQTCRHLQKDKKEFVMSKQLLRSGTGIGANIREAIHAQSKKDFLHKSNIALKEASETEFWIDLLTRTQYLDINENNLISDCIELNKILNTIVKTTKQNLGIQ
jgi:four helix bundle protein